MERDLDLFYGNYSCGEISNEEAFHGLVYDSHVSLQLKFTCVV